LESVVSGCFIFGAEEIVLSSVSRVRLVYDKTTVLFTSNLLLGLPRLAVEPLPPLFLLFSAGA
jgi:hypothetical protein